MAAHGGPGGPHQGQPVLAVGEEERPAAAMVLLHGRGASARDILTLVPEVRQPGWLYLAPEAAGGRWYPERFTAPLERNEPWLSSALALVASTLDRAGAAGVPAERTVLLGFSQGACLALEFAARNARRYGGLVGLSGGLIGPDALPRRYEGSLDGTPAFLGCGDRDPHIPAYRVEAAGAALRALGAEVTSALYPGLGHTVSEDELEHVRALERRLAAA